MRNYNKKAVLNLCNYLSNINVYDKLNQNINIDSNSNYTILSNVAKNS